jgi:primosomal replication protein N
MSAAPALPALNRLVLQAKVLERGAMRYTPAGLPALDLALRHESQLTEAGQMRKVSVEIRAVALGEIAQQVARFEIGSESGFAGFLSAQRNGRGVVFHVTEVA